MNIQDRISLAFELKRIDKEIETNDLSKNKISRERRSEVIITICNFDSPKIETHSWINNSLFTFKCKECGITAESIVINATKPFILHEPYLSCNEMIIKNIL